MSERNPALTVLFCPNESTKCLFRCPIEPIAEKFKHMRILFKYLFLNYVLTMVTICPKCHKRAWKPYRFVIKGKSGKNYAYLVYRHNEKKRHTPRKCYVAIKGQARKKTPARSKKSRSSSKSRKR